MATTASDKAQLISQGQLLPPGNCALCGSGNSEEGYLDIRLFVEFIGQIYFCVRCVEQFISVIDGLNYEEAAELKSQHLKDTSIILSLREDLKKAENDLRTLRGALDLIGLTVPSDTSVSDSSDATQSPQEDVRDEGVGEGEGVSEAGLNDLEVGETESESPEPVKVKRPNDAGNITASDLGI